MPEERTRPPTVRERSREAALARLAESREGVRHAELVRAVLDTDPDLKVAAIRANVWNLHEVYPDEVYKPSRGLFRLTRFREEDSDSPRAELVSKPHKGIQEEDFYQPFADWLQYDLEECTKAIPLGGSVFRDKWGTPDVIGKRESRKSDIIAAPVEIVSAEIKPDSREVITAFGQACAYCLFSHKTYLVVSNSSPQYEIARLDSLCQVFGIGLVLFNATDPQDPNFQIRVRAVKREPDLFYASKYMRIIETELFT